MKKIIPALIGVLLLTGCGYATELPSEELIENLPEINGKASEIGARTVLRSDFMNFDSITDEQIMQLALSDAPNTERISDYYAPELDEDYRIVYIPEGEDLENWCADTAHFTPERAQDYVIDNTELIADTDLYAAYRVTYMENGQRLAEVQLFPRYFLMSGNGYAYYTGGIDESSVLQNFDLIAKDQKMLCRRFRDDQEIKCIAYDFYAVNMLDDGTAELVWYCYLIDRNDHLVSTVPEWNQKRTVSISKDVPQKQPEEAPADASLAYDIQLWASKTEILIGYDESEIIWNAQVPVDCNPDSVYLVDADTGEIAAKLLDEADYEKYGDTIKGDAVYNCRFTVNVDIDTAPDSSEDKYYHYYAEFMEGNVTHRSETMEIWVLEPFTDKELDDMEAVDQAISELMQSEDYRQLSDTEKRDKAVALLEELAAQGTKTHPYSLVEPSSIFAGDDYVSFRYVCGIGSNIMLADHHHKHHGNL